MLFADNLDLEISFLEKKKDHFLLDKDHWKNLHKNKNKWQQRNN